MAPKYCSNCKQDGRRTRLIDLPDYKGYCPTCSDYKVQTEQISPYASMFEDDCSCVLPEQSCPACRAAAREVHNEIPF